MKEIYAKKKALPFKTHNLIFIAEKPNKKLTKKTQNYK